MNDPKIIGPIVWKLIHYFAINSDTKQKRDTFIQFINLLIIIFPCSVCGENLIKEIENLPIKQYINTSIQLAEWTWILHNRVNKRLRNPIFSKKQFYKMYYVKNEENNKIIPINDPLIIGPYIWKSIHYFAANADTQKKRNSFNTFMHLLTIIIPCSICRINLVKEVEILPIKQYINTSIQLAEWTWILHNKVNKKLTKSIFPKEEFIKLYYSNDNCENCTIG